MPRFCLLFVTGWLGAALFATAQTQDSPYLYGIHWYGNTDSIVPGQLTDVETMTGGKGIWVLDIALTDEATANSWDLVWTPGNKALPGYRVSHAEKVVYGKGHSLIYRLQPGWGRNVPHSSDPYTLSDFASDCKVAATLLSNWCHVWVIGNEVNLTDENHRWSGSSYSVPWQPTPAEYAAAYIACRDKIHEVVPNTNPASQVVLMQPPSPGVADGAVRFMDSNEFLLRQIEAVGDKSKIDGFCFHAYAGGGDELREDFFDSLREQLMVIDQVGLGNRPVYIGEWNHYMPNPTETQNGARFLHTTLAALHLWNTGSGGEWPGLSNHNVVTATWFVYPAGFGWDDYSLQAKKTGGLPDTDPWAAFQYACSYGYPRGAVGGGPIVPQSTLWWEDDFSGSTLDQTSPLPDWKAESINGGSVSLTGSGQLRLYGNTAYAGGSISTKGYAYLDFALETDLQFVNATRIANDEANFDLRWREGSRGYSLTFYSSHSTVRPGSVYLRRTNNWGETIASAAIPGGISSGDIFRIFVRSSGSTHEVKVWRLPSQTLVLDWSGPNAIADSGQKVGWLRLMTYNLREVQVDRFAIGGPNWTGSSAAVSEWRSFEK